MPRETQEARFDCWTALQHLRDLEAREREMLPSDPAWEAIQKEIVAAEEMVEACWRTVREESAC